MRTRIAPTPSGLLHYGNACNFLVTWAFGRARGGEVLLRIDDADPNMVHPDGIVDIVDTLAWLGITVDRQLPSQQTRYARYQAVIDELQRGEHLYACDCTRSQIRTASATGEYPGTCRERGLPRTTPEASLRCRLNASVADPIVRGKNGIPAYHIASLCDDVDAGVTHIIRGADLESASEVQRHVAGLAPSLEAFRDIEIIHHPLILGQDGQKLSKSVQSTALRTLREGGLERSRVVETAITLADPITAAHLVDNISTQTSRTIWF